jgi:hypothetical protein
VHRTHVQVKHMVCRTKGIPTSVSTGESLPNARWIAVSSPRSLAFAVTTYWQIKNLANFTLPSNRPLSLGNLAPSLVRAIGYIAEMVPADPGSPCVRVEAAVGRPDVFAGAPPERCTCRRLGAIEMRNWSSIRR